MNRHGWLFLLTVFLLTGCNPAAVNQPATASASPAAPLTPTATATPLPTSIPTGTSTPTPLPTSTPAILLGAGDISICGQTGDDDTARLLATETGEIFTLGDNSNEDGLLYQYQQCFAPSWGKFMDRLHPVPGNHDYQGNGGESYYEYFAERAGPAGKGYYSFDLGAWHIVALNSNCDYVSCREDSAQVKWLREDLAAHPTQCTLAYWHDPMSGSAISDIYYGVLPFWQALYDYNAEIILNGDHHIFEVYAPQNPNLKPDPEHGLTQFIVGTGGASHYPFVGIKPNSLIHDNTTYGILKFKLFSDRYEWEFIPTQPDGFTASGEGVCH